MNVRLIKSHGSVRAAAQGMGAAAADHDAVTGDANDAIR